MAPSPRRSRSRTRSRSFSRSYTRSRSPSRSRSRSVTPRSRSRSRSGSPRSRSRSKTPAKDGAAAPGDSGWDDNVAYDDFVPADEESPTFKLQDSTIDLIRKRVYQAPPLGKKYFQDMKKERYMLPRESHETLEPKPIPPQVVASRGGMDFNPLHNSLLTMHGVARVADRPAWAFMEEVQKMRNNLNKMPQTSFDSPPFLTGPGVTLPSGHIELDYSEEERLRHTAKAPQDPTKAEFMEIYESLGVYKKYHEVASKAMLSMLSSLQEQQKVGGKVKESLEEMWSRIQDFLNMARYRETQMKDMRRSQLVKAHKKDFTDWFDNVYMKDRERVGARDKSDEILAANYAEVIKLFEEFKKNKNSALKTSQHRNPRQSGSGGSGGSGSGRDRYQKDRSRSPARRTDDSRQPRQQNKNKNPRQKESGASASKPRPPPSKKKKPNKDKTA